MAKYESAATVAMAQAISKIKDPSLKAALESQLAVVQEEAAQQAKGKLTLKVSTKGALSIYGMGRFPITHYAAQWERILDSKEEILDFISKHKGELSYK